MTDQAGPAGAIARRPSPAPDASIRAVDRALAILRCFTPDDSTLSLTEIARRTELNKTTALRLLATLEAQAFIVRVDGGGYSLGPTLLQLGEQFQRGLKLDPLVLPALTRLMQGTGESAAFFVREGDARRCIFRVDTYQGIRDHSHVGDLLPLPHGAFGRVLALPDPTPALLDDPAMPPVTRGERDPHLGSIAAPVFGARGKLVGAIGISVPVYRFTDDLADKGRVLVLAEARRVSRELGYSAAA